jgi:CRP-like cAMP-binding protein
MKEGLLEFLNQYAAVSAQDLEELMGQVEVCNYNKKTRLTDIGETEQHMHYIISGLARIYFPKGKEEIITHIVPEGGLVGSAASFFSGMPSKYIVETLEPTTTLVITKQKLENLYQSGKKWEKISRLMITKYFLIQENQLLNNIRLSTKERLKKFMEENPAIVQRVSQKYLASYLNIKPETFSRLKPNLNY